MTEPHPRPASRASFTWHDGDTLLSFGLFAAVVLVLLGFRIADPANWITIADAPMISSCAPVDALQ